MLLLPWQDQFVLGLVHQERVKLCDDAASVESSAHVMFLRICFGSGSTFNSGQEPSFQSVTCVPKA